MHAGGQHHQELQFPAKYASNNPDSACTGRAVFYLNFDAGCSEDGVCPCQCNYASDPTCACRDIDGRISIHVTKSDVRLLYPLTYAKTINYYPIEQVHYGGSCKDGALEPVPTCGWYLLDGEKIDDSQVCVKTKKS
jgi:hypothetical protein